MQLQIIGHGIEVTAALEQAVSKKLANLAKHSKQEFTAKVVLHVDHNEQKAEITVALPNNVLHAEAASHDMYQTLDLLADKIIRQLEKHKERLVS